MYMHIYIFVHAFNFQSENTSKINIMPNDIPNKKKGYEWENLETTNTVRTMPFFE